jgi:glycosyltransferase involved in cell wall biosynthesis
MRSMNPASKRITIFLGDLNMGGAERVSVTLARQLIRRGHRVRLVLAHKAGPLLEEIDPAVEVIDLGAHRPRQPRWLFGLRTLLKLGRHLRKDRPQVVLTTLTGANLTAVLARQLFRQQFRLVIREASSLMNIQSPLRRYAMRMIYPYADHIIALTEHMKENLTSVLNLDARKVHIIGNPVDHGNVKNLSGSRSDSQEIQNLSPFIISVGRLEEPKDFGTIIRAMSLLDGDRINLIILGKGIQRPSLEALIHELGLKKKVHLIGFRANPYPWLAAARALVLSSRWEGYPNILLEARYLGVPIVATRYDDSVFTVLGPCNSAHCRITPVSDPMAMAEAIEEVLSASAEPMKEADASTISGNLEAVIDQYEAALFPTDGPLP